MYARRDRRRRPTFIFDFGGVVIKWKDNVPIYDSIAERYHVPRAELRRVLEDALPKLEADEITIRDFLARSLGNFGKSLRPGDSPEELWTEPFARLARLRVGSVEIVRSLRRRGHLVFLFSNTSYPHARFLRKVGWDKLFDGFLTSCEIRSCKPSPTAFRRALKKFHALPSEVAFVDDKEANVRGAKESGIRWAFKFTSVARLKRDIATLPTDGPAGGPA
jgi:HAD superfamily hydrolase (TIGR01509 family)